MKKLYIRLRVNENTFKPHVFRSGSYTIKVGELGTKNEKVLKNIKTVSDENSQLEVTF